MALNGGSLNSHAVNAATGFTSSIGGGGVVADIIQIVNATGTSSSNIVQLVTVKSATNPKVASIVQIVELHSTSTIVSVVDIEQIVNATGSQSIPLDQVVVDPNANTFYNRNNYEPRLYIDNVRVENNEIHGTIEVVFKENEAPQLTFTLIPPRGAQDIRSYRGKSVILNVRESSGITRLFTGTINEPDVMIIDQKIRLSCSLDINQRIQNNVSQGFINTIGYYSNKVFSKPLTKEQELRDRISTVAKTVDWDAYGNMQVNDIAPKATQDYTLVDADVYRDSLDYMFSSRQRYLNKVEIKANYSFQRLHHYRINYSLANGISICDFLTRSASPIRRDLVTNAVNGTGWVVDSLTFTSFYKSGFYSCSGGTVALLTTKCQTATNPTGNTINGDTQYEAVPTRCVNASSAYCLGASWKLSRQFVQNIKREYTITVEAPQSIADYGQKVKEETFTLTDDYDTKEWEDYTKYTNNPPPGFTKTGTSGNNFWVDADRDKNIFATSANILMNRAKAEILKSHRDDLARFKRNLWSDISLGDTVRLNTGRIVCKGKVKEYRHVLDMNTGEDYTMVDLVFSRSTGSATDSDLKLPAISDSTPDYSITNVGLGSFYGRDITSLANPEPGFYGNWLNTTGVGPTLPSYPIALRIDTPEVQDALRSTQTSTANTTLDVEIPNDELTINFTDDNY